MSSLDMLQIRKSSIEEAKRLGYETNPSLPSLDPPHLRNGIKIFDRMICMQALGACAYGFDKLRAIHWLKNEGVDYALTEEELAFLSNEVGDPNVHIDRIEGVWALAWVLNIVGILDFAQSCHPQFASLLPDPRQDGSSAKYRKQITVRPLEQIVQKLDLSYCLHWAIQSATLRNAHHQAKMEPCVIIERRRALEWCSYDIDWDEVNMDT